MNQMTNHRNNQTQVKIALAGQAGTSGCETAKDEGKELFGEPIHSYTRVQAIEDGQLVDVSEMAQEAGFMCVVALTASAWADCVAWTGADTKRQAVQDEQGRLWDVLNMAMHAARSATGANSVFFCLYRVPRGGRGLKPKLAKLKMTVGGGDEGEMVITIMLPDED